MRILLANYKSFPRLSGTATYMKQLRYKLEQLGHQVDVLAHKPGMKEIYCGESVVLKKSVRQRLEQQLTQIYQTQFPRFSKWMVWRELERYTFEQAVRQFNLEAYDVIHSQDILSTRSLSRAKPETVPLVATFHNCKTKEWRSNGEYKVKSSLELQFIAREEIASVHSPNQLILPCRWLQNEFNEIGQLSLGAHIIPYGIHLEDFFKKARERVSAIKNNKLVIACPARLVPIKGHLCLLAALRRLKETGRYFNCWMIGEGMMMDQLKQEADKLGLGGDVAFLGGRDDVPALLNAADIVVLPSLHDTLPFAVMEGQLVGKPVVASDVGGISEMIGNGRTGLLFQAGESGQLAAALERLLDSGELRDQIGGAARREAVAKWSLDGMIDRTVDVYMQAVSEANNKTLAARVPAPAVPDLELISELTGADNERETPGKLLSGVALDAERQPLRHAVVQLIDYSNIALTDTFTDDYGKFAFPEVPAGKYCVMITVDGYMPFSRNVSISDDAECDIAIQLKMQ